MAFPPKYFFTVLEALARWDCSQVQIAEWAIAGEIDLVVGFSEVWFGENAACGLMSVAGSEIRPLFRPYGRAAKKVYLHRARPPGSESWQSITSPKEGFKVTAADVLITAPEIARFEEINGITRRVSPGPGVSPRYDWEGFYIALVKRLFHEGLPPRQKDLIVEMQEWFFAHSETGEAPDESTIRRRIRAVWQELRPDES